jgi:hypothetical protein
MTPLVTFHPNPTLAKQRDTRRTARFGVVSRRPRNVRHSQAGHLYQSLLGSSKRSTENRGSTMAYVSLNKEFPLPLWWPPRVCDKDIGGADFADRSELPYGRMGAARRTDGRCMRDGMRTQLHSPADGNDSGIHHGVLAERDQAFANMLTVLPLTSLRDLAVASRFHTAIEMSCGQDARPRFVSRAATVRVRTRSVSLRSVTARGRPRLVGQRRVAQ